MSFDASIVVYSTFLAYEVTKAFVQAEKRYFLPVVLFFSDSELRGWLDSGSGTSDAR
jgi:hypothetical protein